MDGLFGLLFFVCIVIWCFFKSDVHYDTVDNVKKRKMRFCRWKKCPYLKCHIRRAAYYTRSDRLNGGYPIDKHTYYCSHDKCLYDKEEIKKAQQINKENFKNLDEDLKDKMTKDQIISKIKCAVQNKKGIKVRHLSYKNLEVVTEFNSRSYVFVETMFDKYIKHETYIDSQYSLMKIIDVSRIISIKIIENKKDKQKN